MKNNNKSGEILKKKPKSRRSIFEENGKNPKTRDPPIWFRSWIFSARHKLFQKIIKKNIINTHENSCILYIPNKKHKKIAKCLKNPMNKKWKLKRRGGEARHARYE